MRRRKFLRTSSIGIAAATGLTGLAIAESGGHQEEIFNQSLQLRSEENWSVTTWRDYLREQGITVGYVDTHIPLNQEDGDGGSGGISTNALSRDRLILSGTFTEFATRSGYKPFIDANWKFELGSEGYPDNYGEDPADAIEIRWDREDYNRLGDSAYYGEHTSNPATDEAITAKTNSGIVAEWDDQTAFEQVSSEPITLQSYFGTGLEYESSASPSDRGISIYYKHFYENVTLDWSFTYGAPSVNPENSTYGWAVSMNANQSEFHNGKTKDLTE